MFTSRCTCITSYITVVCAVELIYVRCFMTMTLFVVTIWFFLAKPPFHNKIHPTRLIVLVVNNVYQNTYTFVFIYYYYHCYYYIIFVSLPLEFYINTSAFPICVSSYHLTWTYFLLMPACRNIVENRSLRNQLCYTDNHANIPF